MKWTSKALIASHAQQASIPKVALEQYVLHAPLEAPGALPPCCVKVSDLWYDMSEGLWYLGSDCIVRLWYVSSANAMTNTSSTHLSAVCAANYGGFPCSPCPENQASAGGVGAVCSDCPSGSSKDPNTLKCDSKECFFLFLCVWYCAHVVKQMLLSVCGALYEWSGITMFVAQSEPYQDVTMQSAQCTVLQFVPWTMAACPAPPAPVASIQWAARAPSVASSVLHPIGSGML